MAYSLDVVANHVRLQEASGLSVSRYCSRHGRSTPTFYTWRRKHIPPIADDGTDKPCQSDQPVPHRRFTRLQPVGSPDVYVLTTPGGSRIELGELSIAELAGLVRLLESIDA